MIETLCWRELLNKKMLQQCRRAAQSLFRSPELAAFYATEAKPKRATKKAQAASESDSGKPTTESAAQNQVAKQHVGKDWSAVKIPEQIASDIPTTLKGISFGGDLRSTSGLGLGDGLKSHTEKWLQVRCQSFL